MKLKNYLSICFLSLSILSVAQTGVTYSVSVSSGGSARTYTYYVPTMYNSTTDTIPVVINIHGYTGSSNAQAIAEDFRKIADTANFIVIHPQALGTPGLGSNPTTSWDVWNSVQSGAADRTFIMAALDSIEAHYNIDTNRVYVTGYSQGGYMSYNLSTNYSHRITAMASVCGAMAIAYYDSSYPVHPLPVMEIHGTNDAVVSYTGGNNGQPVETTVGHWIQFNHCDTIPVINSFLPDVADSATVDKSKVVHYLFTGGCKGVTVELYKVLNGGHQIPSLAPVPTSYGIGNTNQDFTAAKEIWRFFSQYRLDSLYKGVPDTVCVPLSIPPPTPATIPSPPFVATGINNIAPFATGTIIYPNPSSNGIFTVQQEESENISIVVTTVLGKQVYAGDFSGKTIKINLSAMPDGIYFYTIKNQAGSISSGKLIIQ